MPMLPIYQVDAFTSQLFHGNPAAVVPLEAWLSDATMQAIATENNLSETAFFTPVADGEADYHLRWFTPKREVELCGHATLATAHVIWEHLNSPAERLVFSTQSSGLLTVTRDAESRIVLDLPARAPAPLGLADPARDEVAAALGRAPVEVLRAGAKLLAIYENKRDVHEVSSDFRALAAIDAEGVIVTAPGAGHDFVSRFFAPNVGVDEDPVTGSAHCVLAPYWSARLGKRSLTAHQVSARGGELWCTFVPLPSGDRVHIAGHGTTFLKGEIQVPEFVSVSVPGRPQEASVGS